MRKVSVVLAVLLLILAGCGDKAQTVQQGQELEVVRNEQAGGRINVYWVNCLPDEKWLYLEPPGDMVRNFWLEKAYYYNDTDYLACGRSVTRAGSQLKVICAENGLAQELVCVWPEDSLHEYADSIGSYYLPAQDELVLYNRQQHKFLIYDNASGEAREFTPPATGELEIWLGGERYLLGRLLNNEKEPHRSVLQINLYDLSTGAEQHLADFTNPNFMFTPSTAEQPERCLLLSAYGELLDLSLPEGQDEPQVQLYDCSASWQPATPWLYYGEIMPLKGRENCFVWQVWCEDGEHYQAVDLADGSLLGEYIAQGNGGGGLIDAQGDKIYLSEYYQTSEPGESCKIMAYDLTSGRAEQVVGAMQDDLHSLYPNDFYIENSTDNYFISAGAISPGGDELLLLDAGYVISLRLND